MIRIKRWTGRAAMALLVIIFAAVLAYSFPADLALLLAIDVATYVDALVGVYVIAQVTRLRPLIALGRASLAARFGRRSRRATAMRPSKRTSAANDDDPGLAVAA